MTCVLPKLRNDLTISQQRSAQGTFFIVKNPGTGEFFRLREAERFIADQFDGATPVEVIRRKVEEKFGADLSSESLGQFIKKLDKGGLLESEKNERKAAAAQSRRLQGIVLYVRFKVCDPDAFFNCLIRRIGFFFTPQFVVLSAVCILTAITVLAGNWNDIRGGLSRLWQPGSIPMALLIIFSVIGLHEFAHGLTCKHFGGEVHELGLLLIYFQPAFYCNVSDAWLFPEKSKRLWVGFAGPYFELFLWSVATLLWRLTDVDTGINFAAYVVMTSSGLKTLLNFNPLIKLDGYYLLSDYTEIPNLRKRAFSYVGRCLSSLFGSASVTGEEMTRSQQRICLAYGLVAALGSISVLGYAMGKLGAYLVEQNQPWGFLLFAGLFAVKCRRRFQRLFSRSAAARSGHSDLPDEPPADHHRTEIVTNDHPTAKEDHTETQPDHRQALPENGAAQPTPQDTEQKESAVKPEKGESKKNAKARKRKWSFWKRLLLALVAVGGAAPLLFYGQRELKIRGQFNVLPVQNADVRSAVEGLIENIFVDEGNEVRAGDMIAQLSDRDLQAELKKTEAEIAQTRARLNMLEAGPTKEEIAVARAAVSRAEDRVAYARNRLVRDKALFEQNLLSQKDFEDTQERAVTDQNDLAEARSKLNLLLSGARPEAIAATKAELARFESQGQFLAEQLRLLKVASPISGIVATPSLQLREMKHRLVRKGDLIAKVYDFKTVTAEIVTSEKDIADVEVGQKVLLKARAYPEKMFSGTVTAIATSAQISSTSGATAQAQPNAPAVTRANVSAKMILVTTQIDNNSLLLKPEMTGQAKIFCGQRRIIDLATRKLARTLRVEFWSWW